MADKQEEIDVMFDANTASITRGFEYIQSEVARLKKSVQDIGKDSYKSANDFGLSLTYTVKQLQNALGQMRTLAANGLDGGSTQKGTQEAKLFFKQQEADRKESNRRQLADERATLSEMDRRGAESARIAADSAKMRSQAKVEAARAEIQANARAITSEKELNAERQKNAENLTRFRAAAKTENDPVQQRALQTLIQLEKDRAAALKVTARELEALSNIKTRQINTAFNTNTLDTAALAAAARKKQQDYDRALKATADPKASQESNLFVRNDLAQRAAAVKALNAEERAGADQVAAMNRAQAQRDAADDAARLERSRLIRTSRLEAGKATVVDQTKAIRSEEELALARAKNVDILQRLRTAQKVETDPEQLRAIAALVQIEKARAQAIEQTTRELAKLKQGADGRLDTAKVAKALAPGDIRDLAMQTSPKQALLGTQFEQEAARRSLLAASTEAERVAALKNLDIANARVNASKRLVAEEEKVVAAEMRIGNRDLSGQQRAQITLAQQYAREMVSQQGVAAALAGQKVKQIEAEQRLRVATAETRGEAQRALDVENARLKALQKEADASENARRGSLFGRAETAIKNTALYGLVAGAGYAAFNVVQTSLSNIIELEDEFVKLQAISNSTDEQMKGLQATIYGIGEGSRFAVNDLVKIAQTLAQAGVGARDMGKVLNSVITLATASGSTPDEAVQLVTSALGSFQLQASEAARVADLMTSALNRTKLTVGQVAQAIQYVGATAYEQNISLETLLATVGAVAQGGVRSGSTIGTGFRQFLVDLSSPSQKLTAQLDRLGITQDQVNVKTKGLATVLETLKSKGFGATQAYDGLETRAAAFYLVAKNNVDVMSELQLSFAQSGAAAIANERAMNSLTAQWQRFKNVLQEGLSDSLDGTMATLKNIIQALTDRILELREARMQADQRRADGTNSFMEADIGKYGEEALRRTFNVVGNTATLGQVTNVNPLTGSGKGFGDWINSWSEDTTKASAATEIYATKIKEATEDVDTHATAINEADKEMERLVAQQSSLINNQKLAQAETVTLSARFGGLVKYLGTTKNAYLDLIQAMGQYRGEENRFLAKAYEGQVAVQTKQNNSDSRALTSNLLALRNNPEAMKALTPNERSLVNTPDLPARLAKNDPNDIIARNFTAALSEAARRISETNSKLGDVVADTSILSSRIEIGNRAVTRGRQLGGQAAAAGTQAGISTQGFLDARNNELEGLNGKDQNERAAAGAALTTRINTNIGTISARLATVKDEANRTFLQGAIDTLRAMLGQVASAIKPTTDEIKAAKQAKADKDRQDAEDAKRPLVTKADVDAVVIGGTGTGFADRVKNLGERSAANAVSPKGARGTMQVMSGTISDPGYGVRAAADNTIAEIDRVGRDYANALLKQYKNETLAAAAYNAGPGQLDKWLKSIGDPRKGGMTDAQFASRIPFKETRDYVGRVVGGGGAPKEGVGGYSVVGLSDEKAELKADTVRNALKNAGIDATVTIDKAQKRLVITVRKGTRFTKDRTEEQGSRFDARMAQDTVSLDQANLKTQLKIASKADTGEAFNTAVDAARAAMDKLNTDIMDAALQELAAAGISEESVSGQAKVAQVKAAILQNFEEFQQNIADAILKSAKKQMAAAQTAFDQALAPAQATLAVAQSQLSGLDAFSLRNKVPDYVKASASDRVAQAQEGVVRAEYNATPALIAAKQAAIDNVTKQSAEKGVTPENTAEIAAMNVELSKLIANRAALQAQLGAGDLIPTTIGQGINAAIEQYRQANDLTKDFKDTVIMNLTGGIAEIQGGLTDMFSSIFSGSKSALGAFGQFAKGIGQYLMQLAAKFAASQILNLLLSFAGSAFGAKVAPGGTVGSDIGLTGSAAVANVSPGIGSFVGGPAFPGLMTGGTGSGEVTNGSDKADSVTKSLAKGEWVINKKAVDSVGNKFMADLNNHGAAALQMQGSVQPINMVPKQEMGVYVVAPSQQPSLSKNDVLVTLQQDILSGGETKKLIKFVQQGG